MKGGNSDVRRTLEWIGNVLYLLYEQLLFPFLLKGHNSYNIFCKLKKQSKFNNYSIIRGKLPI